MFYFLIEYTNHSNKISLNILRIISGLRFVCLANFVLLESFDGVRDIIQVQREKSD
jgi:hypothetical protein